MSDVEHSSLLYGVQIIETGPTSERVIILGQSEKRSKELVV
jgi:hypothetical protein